jgi:hypothetical protein
MYKKAFLSEILQEINLIKTITSQKSRSTPLSFIIQIICTVLYTAANALTAAKLHTCIHVWGSDIENDIDVVYMHGWSLFTC